MYGMTTMGSGIPMLDINEEKDEDMNSSDNDSLEGELHGAHAGDDDDFFQMRSKNFSRAINMIVE